MEKDTLRVFFCFLIEGPNYLNQFCIVLLAALSCKKEFFLNTEIFYKISENYWWGNCPTCPTGSDACKIYLYIISWSLDSNYGRTKLYMICINVD